MKFKIIEIKHKNHWDNFHHICKEEIFKDSEIEYDKNHPSFNDANSQHLVIMIGSKVSGAIKIQKIPNTSGCILRIIALDKSYQNKEFGKLALAKLEYFLQGNGIDTIYLNSAPKVKVFYEKCGYEPFNFPDDGSAFEDSIQYKKYIGKAIEVKKIRLNIFLLLSSPGLLKLCH